jgi:hypothetical protein
MFVSYNKKSKKNKRIDDLEKRVTWGFSPVTRIKPSKKIYNRKKNEIKIFILEGSM